MRIRYITTLAILLITLLMPAHADRGVGGIVLSANPSSLPSDGTSFSTISAEIRDSDGKFAPDGTEVRFTASLGEIEEVSEVRAGVARVRLMSSNVPGTSTVTATWLEGQAVSRMMVQFGGATMPKGPEYIDVRADHYMAYSVDHQALEAIGNVRIKYRSLQLEAQSVQIDLARSRIVAKSGGPDSPVRLISGKEVFEASMFTCDLYASQGLMISAQKGKVQSLMVTGNKWSLGPDQTSYLPEEFDFKDLSDSGILIRAKQATVFPNDKIQFRNANVFVDGKKMLSLPLYVLSLTDYQPDGGQYVGYSTGGITVNLPFYYALTPQSSGALLVRHGQSSGWGQYGQTPGWFIDLRQRYRTDTSDGMLTLSQISNKWGAQLTHSQQFGKNMNGYLYLDYPEHESLFGSMSLNKTFKGFSAGMNMYGSDYSAKELGAEGHTKGADVYVQTQSAKLAKTGMKYTVSARGSQAQIDGVKSASQRLDTNIYTAPIKLTKTLSLRGAGSGGYVFGVGKLSGISSTATAVMDLKLRKQNSFQLSYRFSSRPTVGFHQITNQAGEQEDAWIREHSRTQALSAYLRLGKVSKWFATMYATKGLDYPAQNLFVDVSYRLDSQWRLTARSTSNSFGASHYDDVEFGLGKVIGSRELIAVWSRKEGRVMLELGSSGF